jgi:glycosyltransferase involved in cell wall biosynthesis
MEKISIITPTHNHQKYIAQCLISVINQTYKNWEMIVVDDGSADKTPQIIYDFSKKDKRIKPVFHKKNWGIKKLKDIYNQALKLTKGEVIAILEGDDFWPKYKLQKQIKAFTDSDVIFSYGNWAMTSQSGKVFYTRKYNQFNKNFLNNNPIGSILNLFLTLQFDIGSQAVMIRKKTLIEIGGFQSDKNYPFIDIPTYLHLALKGKFSFLPLLLGYYRRTQSSAWFSFSSQSSTMGREEIRNCINHFVKNKAKNILKNIDWNEIEIKQKNYLLQRKFTKILSEVLNRVLTKI